MAERDFQDFGPREGLCQPRALAYIPPALGPLAVRADTPSVWGSQLRSSLWLDYPSPLHDQTTTCAGTSDEMDSHLGPGWALTSVTARLGQFPETGSHTIPAPDWPDWQFLDEFRAFSESQARTNGPRPDRYITDQIDDILHRTGGYAIEQSVNPPCIQGTDTQFRSPVSYIARQAPSSHVSSQQSGHTPGVLQVPPFQHHAAPIFEGLEFTVPLRVPEMESSKRSNRGRRMSKKCLCHYVNCGKSYGRPQDLERHIREKHQALPECPFCDTNLARAEKIRRHLIIKHQDRFTEKELRQIRRLKSRTDTIRLVRKCGTPKLPGSNTPYA